MMPWSPVWSQPFLSKVSAVALGLERYPRVIWGPFARILGKRVVSVSLLLEVEKAPYLSGLIEAELIAL